MTEVDSSSRFRKKDSSRFRYIFLNKYIYIYVDVYVYIYIYIYIYICAYVCLYIYIYMTQVDSFAQQANRYLGYAYFHRGNENTQGKWKISQRKQWKIYLVRTLLLLGHFFAWKYRCAYIFDLYLVQYIECEPYSSLVTFSLPHSSSDEGGNEKVNKALILGAL